MCIAGCIPQTKGVVFGSRDDLGAIGGECDRSDRIGMSTRSGEMCTIATSYRRRVPSTAPDKMRVLSRENATSLTMSECRWCCEMCTVDRIQQVKGPYQDLKQVKWPVSTDLIFNSSGVANLKLPSESMRNFMEHAIKVMLLHVSLRDAYPDLTKKGNFIMKSLHHTVINMNFKDILFWLKEDRQYTSSIAQVVAQICALRFIH
jgi:hypothetical protein